MAMPAPLSPEELRDLFDLLIEEEQAEWDTLNRRKAVRTLFKSPAQIKAANLVDAFPSHLRRAILMATLSDRELACWALELADSHADTLALMGALD